LLRIKTACLREFGVGRFPKNSESFAFSAFQFFNYHLNTFENYMNIQSTNFPKSHFANIVAASLCRGVFALLPPRSRRRSAVATALFATVLSSVGANLAIAGIININPSKDNTLYEYVPADGDVSNALGFHFFSGETADGELRRGVLAFDIAGTVPPHSTITGVTLSLNMSRAAFDTDRTVELHWRRRHGSAGHAQRRHMATSLFRYHFLDDGGWGFFRHSERKPVGWRHWSVHMEFVTDDCRRAIVAG
jgi:hypothetical protein